MKSTHWTKKAIRRLVGIIIGNPRNPRLRQSILFVLKFSKNKSNDE